jgi:hypothetical protein
MLTRRNPFSHGAAVPLLPSSGCHQRQFEQHAKTHSFQNKFSSLKLQFFNELSADALHLVFLL